MGIAFLTNKKIVNDKKKKFRDKEMTAASTMIKYLGLVENYHLGIKDNEKVYELIGYYNFQDKTNPDVVFEIYLDKDKIGEVWYNYKKEETIKSEFSYLLDELENKPYFNTIVSFRGDWLYNNFEYFKLKKEKEASTKPIDYSKVGRNDPCPCNSGKKYKKCCFNKINN